MAERWKEFAEEWSLGELPDYLARLAMPLFDLNDPERMTDGLTVVWTTSGAVVGMLKNDGQGRGGVHETTVLTASLAPGALTVARHTDRSDVRFSPCPLFCDATLVTGEGIRTYAPDSVQQYGITPHTDAGTFVGEVIAANLTGLAAAHPGQDVFSPESHAGTSEAGAAFRLHMSGHRFDPAAQAVQRDMLRF